MIKYRIQKEGNYYYPLIKKGIFWWANLLNLQGEIRRYRKERDAKNAFNIYKRYGKHHTIGKLGRMI